MASSVTMLVPSSTDSPGSQEMLFTTPGIGARNMWDWPSYGVCVCVCMYMSKHMYVYVVPTATATSTTSHALNLY